MSASAPLPPAPAICRLSIERFRGVKSLVWHPMKGVNVVLGGGDVGKTTILDAIGLLLSPVNPANLADTDYHARDIAAGFVIEAVVSLPPGSGISDQLKPSWPWEWNGTDVSVPSAEEDGGPLGDPVYRLRVRGTEDLELVYEVVQPDGSPGPAPFAIGQPLRSKRRPMSSSIRRIAGRRVARNSANGRCMHAPH